MAIERTRESGVERVVPVEEAEVRPAAAAAALFERPERRVGAAVLHQRAVRPPDGLAIEECARATERGLVACLINISHVRARRAEPLKTARTVAEVRWEPRTSRSGATAEANPEATFLERRPCFESERILGASTRSPLVGRKWLDSGFLEPISCEWVHLSS